MKTTNGVLSIFLSSCTLVLFLCGPASSAYWSAAADMLTARNGHAATVLQDGRLLVTGGQDSDRNSMSSAELYDPETNSWSFAADMPIAPENHNASLLKDSRVFVTAGANRTPQLYNPATDSWSAAAGMLHPRESHKATVLLNGRVLLTGGSGGIHNEVYDPNTDSWSTAGIQEGTLCCHETTVLEDGRVLLTGGRGDEVEWYENEQSFSKASLYAPDSNSWSTAGSMSTQRATHTATVLKDGRVLVVGGSSYDNGRFGGNCLSSAEVYDPETDSWSDAGGLSRGRIYHRAMLLQDGRVLIIGGWGCYHCGGSITCGLPLSTVELYDPESNSWSSTANMSTDRAGHTATMPANDLVLVTGGHGENITPCSSAELYNPLGIGIAPISILLLQKSP